MCGIAGILTSRSDLDLPSLLQNAVGSLRHRGPDDRGCEVVDAGAGWRLGLAHTRLAILDLSQDGHQPMQDPSSGSWIAYNGEVYNHLDIRRGLPPQHFRSTSDTETILKGWAVRGADLLPKLSGMFAFAVFDAARRQLTLVRDRFGIKPLYVARPDDRTWIFASELRTLLGTGLVPRKLDRQGLSSYLAFGAVSAPATLVEGVASLLPAEVWRFDLAAGSVSPHRSFFWKPSREVRQESRADSVARVRPALLDACQSHMLSDVPVGVFLSGGIDSSVVVATLRHQGFALKTFSVVLSESDFDESSYSREIASHFGTEHVELPLSPTEVVADLPEALAAYDQPSIDGVNTYFISRTVRREGLKVALSGLGGDEFFAGYPYFRWIARTARLPRPLLRLAADLLLRIRPNDARFAKLSDLATARNAVDRYIACRRLFSPLVAAELFPPTADSLPDEWRRCWLDETRGRGRVQAESLLEAAHYMANMLLRDGDQMSMAHALEVRFPLLDPKLVDEVLATPERHLLAASERGKSKSLLLDACPVPLPPRVVQRKKMGFVLPWNHWLKNELRPWVERSIYDVGLWNSLGLDPAAVAKTWSEFVNANRNPRYSEVLSLVHLAEWCRRNGVVA